MSGLILWKLVSFSSLDSFQTHSNVETCVFEHESALSLLHHHNDARGGEPDSTMSISPKYLNTRIHLGITTRISFFEQGKGSDDCPKGTVTTRWVNESNSKILQSMDSGENLSSYINAKAWKLRNLQKYHLLNHVERICVALAAFAEAQELPGDVTRMQKYPQWE